MKLSDLKPGDTVLVKTYSSMDGWSLVPDGDVKFKWLYMVRDNYPDQEALKVLVPFSLYKWENKRFHADIEDYSSNNKIFTKKVKYSQCDILNGFDCIKCCNFCGQQCFHKMKYFFKLRHQ